MGHYVRKDMNKTAYHLRDLEGKFALITGAASGIGNALALAFMTAGVGVVVVDKNDQPLREVSWRDYHYIFKADVCDPATLWAPFNVLEKTHRAYDIVVHCAGVAGGHAFETMPDSEWNNVVGTNLTGTFNVAREACQHFIRNKKKGSLILMGSISGIVANGLEFQNAHYCASKGGVHALARSLAVEMAPHGVRVNVVAPGLTKTEMVTKAINSGRGEAIAAFEKRHPLGANWPVDVVGPVLFLASNMSSKVTGHILNVDGGYCAQ